MLPKPSTDSHTHSKLKMVDDDVKRDICVGLYSFKANFSQLI